MKSRVAQYELLLTVFAGILLAGVILTRWILPLFSPLWLDETATQWIIHTGWRHIPERAAMWGNDESVPYMSLAWLSEKALGVHEPSLRLPSLMAMAGAALLLYRLGVRLIGRESALFAAFVFLSLRSVMFAGVDARAYAPAMLAFVGGAFGITYWLDAARLAAGLAGSLLLVLALCFHPLFAWGLLPLAVSAILRLRKSGSRVRVQALLVVAAGVVAGIPFAAQFFWLTRNAGKISFVAVPSPVDLLQRILPVEMIPALLCAVVALRVAPRRLATIPAAQRSVVFLIFSWWLLPILGSFAVSTLTPARIFVPRYLLAAAPGFALCSGWVLQGLEPRLSRLAVLVALLATSLGSLRPAHGEEAKEAFVRVGRAVAGTATPVAIASGFAESMDPARYAQLTPDSYLLAPLAMYPVDAHIVPLPASMDPNSERFIESGPLQELTRGSEFWLIARAGSSLPQWFESRLRPLGWAIFRDPGITSWQMCRMMRTPAPAPAPAAPHE